MTGERPSLGSHEEVTIMLSELQLCQEHLNTSYMRSWQSGAIILAGGLASLALTLDVGTSDLAAAVITTVFAVGVVLVLGLWLLFLQRETAFQRVSIRRSRELERKLGMKRSLLIRSLDDLIEYGKVGQLEPDEYDRAVIDDIYTKSYRGRRVPILTPGGTSDTLYKIGFLVMAGWTVVVAWRWLIVAGVMD